MAPDDEQELILRSRNGDPEAFAALIRTYQRMVHNVTYRMTGSLADAEDLAQETFVQAYRHLQDFRREAKFSSWLYRVAMNASLNWTKRQRRREQIHQEWSEQLRDDGPADEAISRMVQDALLKLPPTQRAAVVLTTYDGLNHAEAADVLGCSEATVSWRMFAARMKLRRLLRNLSRSRERPDE